MLKELYLLWLRLAAPQDLHYINGADTLPPPAAGAGAHRSGCADPGAAAGTGPAHHT